MKLHWVLLLILTSSCTLMPPAQPPSGIAYQDLLDGRALFGETIKPSDLDPASILHSNRDMRDFVTHHVGDAPSAGTRLRRLLGGMIEEGYLDLVYEPGVTHTAAQTFAAKSGNCLSFTNLFVALARLADLDVQFQLVDIPPAWDAQGQWIVLDKHINVVVRDIRTSVFNHRDYVVDFNIAEFQGNYDRRRVSDRHAYSLYFSNRGVEAMQAGDARRALAFFKRAIDLNPKIPAAWVNLGALYSSRALPDHAIVAWRRALDIEATNRSALLNLAQLFRARGDLEQAGYYEDRIDHYRQRNPYFHFQHALTAYQSDELASAQTALKRAIRLKQDEHQFHFLAALIAFRLEQPERASKSLALALEHAQQERVREHYARKLSGVVKP